MSSQTEDYSFEYDPFKEDTTKNDVFNSKKFECEICHKTICSLKNLKKHKKLHLNLRNYICKTCGNSFKRSDHLQRHMLVHSDNAKRFVCQYCNKKFLFNYHLRSHIEHVHSGNREVFTCEKCSEQFNKKCKLLKHERREHKEKLEKFKCFFPYCPKLFLMQKKLDEHLEKYHGNYDIFDEEKNICNEEAVKEKLEQKFSPQKYKTFFKCPFENCTKIYSTKYNLSVHIKTNHLKIKEFKCNFCGKSFYHNLSLKKHIKKEHDFNEDLVANKENKRENDISIVNIWDKDSVNLDGELIENC